MWRWGDSNQTGQDLTSFLAGFGGTLTKPLIQGLGEAAFGDPVKDALGPNSAGARRASQAAALAARRQGLTGGMGARFESDAVSRFLRQPDPRSLMEAQLAQQRQQRFAAPGQMTGQLLQVLAMDPSLLGGAGINNAPIQPDYQSFMFQQPSFQGPGPGTNPNYAAMVPWASQPAPAAPDPLAFLSPFFSLR